MPTLLSALEQARARRRRDPSASLVGLLAAQGLLPAETLVQATQAGLTPDAVGRGAPDRFGPYRVDGELGRGGMGAVFAATHTATGVRYALKTLTRGPGGLGPDELARFEREGQLLAQLDHPGIVRVHTAGVEGGVPFLVQELVEGGSLQERLAREGPLAPDAALALARDLALAVAHAHDRGVLHRDLKPHNVLLGAQGRPRLTDFGLARSASGSLRLTATGEVLGTPGFMAPEQARGERGQDERTDVYGLGATLFALLTGRPPFVAASALATLAAIADEAPPAVRALRPEASPALAAVCARALAKDPSERFPSAAAFAAALDAAARAPHASAGRRLPVVAGLGLLGLLGLALAALGRGASPSPGAGGPRPPVAPSARPAPSAVEVAEELLAALAATPRDEAALEGAVRAARAAPAPPLLERAIAHAALARGDLEGAGSLGRSDDPRDRAALELEQGRQRLLRALPLEAQTPVVFLVPSELDALLTLAESLVAAAPKAARAPGGAHLVDRAWLALAELTLLAEHLRKEERRGQAWRALLTRALALEGAARGRRALRVAAAFMDDAWLSDEPARASLLARLRRERHACDEPRRRLIDLIEVRHGMAAGVDALAPVAWPELAAAAYRAAGALDGLAPRQEKSRRHRFCEDVAGALLRYAGDHLALGHPARGEAWRQAALRVARAGQRLSPGPQSRMTLAQALLLGGRRGEVEQARELLAAELEAAPTAEEGRLARLLLAECDLALEEPQRALPELTALVEQDPDDAGAGCALAHAQALTGQSPARWLATLNRAAQGKTLWTFPSWRKPTGSEPARAAAEAVVAGDAWRPGADPGPPATAGPPADLLPEPGGPPGSVAALAAELSHAVAEAGYRDAEGLRVFDLTRQLVDELERLPAEASDARRRALLALARAAATPIAVPRRAEAQRLLERALRAAERAAPAATAELRIAAQLRLSRAPDLALNLAGANTPGLGVFFATLLEPQLLLAASELRGWGRGLAAEHQQAARAAWAHARTNHLLVAMSPGRERAIIGARGVLARARAWKALHRGDAQAGAAWRARALALGDAACMADNESNQELVHLAVTHLLGGGREDVARARQVLARITDWPAAQLATLQAECHLVAGELPEAIALLEDALAAPHSPAEAWVALAHARALARVDAPTPQPPLDARRLRIPWHHPAQLEAVRGPHYRWPGAW